MTILRFIRNTLANNFFTRGVALQEAGTWRITNFQKGSYGYELGLLMLAFADLEVTIAEAITAPES